MTKHTQASSDIRQSQNKSLLLEQLKKTPIIQIACEKTEVSRSTYYRWRKDDEAFAQAIDEAIKEGASLVNDMAESQLLAAIRERNLNAIIFWLRHHSSTYKTKVELSGQVNTTVEMLSPEKQEIVAKALKLAAWPIANINIDDNDSD